MYRPSAALLVGTGQDPCVVMDTTKCGAMALRGKRADHRKTAGSTAYSFRSMAFLLQVMGPEILKNPLQYPSEDPLISIAQTTLLGLERHSSPEMADTGRVAPRAIILCFFFLFIIPIQDVIAKGLRAMEETRADRSFPGANKRGSPTIS